MKTELTEIQSEMKSNVEDNLKAIRVLESDESYRIIKKRIQELESKNKELKSRCKHKWLILSERTQHDYYDGTTIAESLICDICGEFEESERRLGKRSEYEYSPLCINRIESKDK